MGYDQPQQSSSSAVAAAITVALLIVVVLAVLAAAALWLYQVQGAPREAAIVVERDRAIAEAQLKEAGVQLQQANAAQSQMGQPVARGQSTDGRDALETALTVTVNQEGNASIDGESVSPGELRARLEALRSETSDAARVRIIADPQCPLGDVIPLLDVCHEAGGVDVRIVSADSSELQGAS